MIDSANLAQNLQTAAQEVIAVEQLKAQLAQLEQTYQMFTNPTNILGMAAGMENQSIENPMPVANAMAGLVGDRPRRPVRRQVIMTRTMFMRQRTARPRALS